MKRCPTPEECESIDIRTSQTCSTRPATAISGETRRRSSRRRRRVRGIRVANDAFSFQIKLLAKQIEFIEGQAAEVDEKIKALLDEIEPLIPHHPRHSYKLGAQIVAEIGDVRRFKNAGAIVKYAGINPSKSQSGTFEGDINHITKQGSPYLRRALYLAAMAQLKCKTPLHGYYLKKRSEERPIAKR